MIRRLLASLLSVFGIAAQTGASDMAPAPPSQEELSKLKDDLSTLAVRIGKENFSLELDYSEESIRHVEFILGEIHSEYVRTKDEEGLHGIAAEYGAYIIKVIERHYEPGVWRRDHPALGVGSFPYEWKGATLFPTGWCLKRIYDGAGDDIDTKYKLFVIEHAEKTK